MKPSTKNRVAGKAHEVKGKVKEATGILVEDRDLEARGTAEKLEGKFQQKVGQVQQVFEK